VSRDPSGEKGGRAIYNAMKNALVIAVDAFGLDVFLVNAEGKRVATPADVIIEEDGSMSYLGSFSWAAHAKYRREGWPFFYRYYVCDIEVKLEVKLTKLLSLREWLAAPTRSAVERVIVVGYHDPRAVEPGEDGGDAGAHYREEVKAHELGHVEEFIEFWNGMGPSGIKETITREFIDKPSSARINGEIDSRIGALWKENVAPMILPSEMKSNSRQREQLIRDGFRGSVADPWVRELTETFTYTFGDRR
jgi:hypothetical protein